MSSGSHACDGEDPVGHVGGRPEVVSRRGIEVTLAVCLVVAEVVHCAPPLQDTWTWNRLVVLPQAADSEVSSRNTSRPRMDVTVWFAASPEVSPKPAKDLVGRVRVGPHIPRSRFDATAAKRVVHCWIVQPMARSGRHRGHFIQIPCRNRCSTTELVMTVEVVVDVRSRVKPNTPYQFSGLPIGTGNVYWALDVTAASNELIPTARAKNVPIGPSIDTRICRAFSGSCAVD